MQSLKVRTFIMQMLYKCSLHSDSFVCSICSNQNCLAPLCPRCLSQHDRAHKQSLQIYKSIPLKVCIQQARKSLTNLKIRVIQTEKLLDTEYRRQVSDAVLSVKTQLMARLNTLVQQFIFQSLFRKNQCRVQLQESLKRQKQQISQAEVNLQRGWSAVQTVIGLFKQQEKKHLSLDEIVDKVMKLEPECKVGVSKDFIKQTRSWLDKIFYFEKLQFQPENQPQESAEEQPAKRPTQGKSRSRVVRTSIQVSDVLIRRFNISRLNRIQHKFI